MDAKLLQLLVSIKLFLKRDKWQELSGSSLSLNLLPRLEQTT